MVRYEHLLPEVGMSSFHAGNAHDVAPCWLFFDLLRQGRIRQVIANFIGIKGLGHFNPRDCIEFSPRGCGCMFCRTTLTRHIVPSKPWPTSVLLCGYLRDIFLRDARLLCPGLDMVLSRLDRFSNGQGSDQ